MSLQQLAEQVVRRTLEGSTFDGQPRSPELVAAVVAASWKQMCRCLLCSRPSDLFGCFVPDRPWEHGNPVYVPGKARLIFYGLCDACSQQPDCSKRVEQRTALYA